MSKYKVGDLVQWSSRVTAAGRSRASRGLQRKGFIVAIREDLEDPGDKRDLVYDIQWFGIDPIDRMIDIWFEPLTMEVQKNEV